MAVALRRFTTNDLRQYQAWLEAIDAQCYMSHWFPASFDGHIVNENPNVCWFVIVYNDLDAGSVWLEREDAKDYVFQLGILIGREELLGKGIGREAIEQAILATQTDIPFTAVRLNVRKDNTRAIACYMACSFRMVGQGVKTNAKGERIEFLTMERVTPNNSFKQTPIKPGAA